MDFKCRVWTAVSLLSLGLAGCHAGGSGMCEPGKRATAAGEVFCVYEAVVIETGFRCPSDLPFRHPVEGGVVCSSSDTELPDELCAELPLGCERLDGSISWDASIAPDARQDNDAGVSDSGLQDSGDRDSGATACADRWASPSLAVEATSRPATSGMRIDFRYGVDAEDRGEIVLEALSGTSAVQPSEGPFMVGTYAGPWVELQDGAGNTLYTRGAFELLPENLEAVGPDGGFINLDYCPDTGQIRLGAYANLPAATHVVFFDEPIDGTRTFAAAQEIARFALP